MDRGVSRFSLRRGRIELHIEALRAGRDLCVVVTGGDGHVGAAALGLPEGDPAVVSAPGHREDALSARMAGALSRRLNVTAAVVCGIHYNGITKGEIDDALSLAGLAGRLIELPKR